MNPTPSQPERPEPPEGYRHMVYEELRRELPLDAMCWNGLLGKWLHSTQRGIVICEADRRECFYATRTPAPEAVSKEQLKEQLANMLAKAPEAVAGEPIDPPGLKGGPGRQAKLVREYLGKFHVQGDNPPVIVAENGEALLSMMWPVHEQTPEGEKAAEEYTKGLANRIADALNATPPADKDAEIMKGYGAAVMAQHEAVRRMEQAESELTTARATIAEKDAEIARLKQEIEFVLAGRAQEYQVSRALDAQLLAANQRIEALEGAIRKEAFHPLGCAGWGNRGHNIVFSQEKCDCWVAKALAHAAEVGKETNEHEDAGD